MAGRDAGIRVDGAKQLRKSLKAAGADLTDLKASHKQAAEIAARASAALAPVGATRRLQGSVRGAGTTTAGIIRAGKKSVPYANAVHWGRKFWPNRTHARRTRSATRAQPFISQGARGSEGQWLPVYEATVQKSLDKIKGI